MICPLCGHESGALVNTPDGPMCPRCRDFGPGERRETRVRKEPDHTNAYLLESSVMIAEAVSKLSNALMCAIAKGDMNTAEIINEQIESLGAIVDRNTDIIKART